MSLSITPVEIINAATRALAAGLHVCLPGRVEAYNPLTQSASITPAIRNPIANPLTGDLESEEPVTLPNVPIVWPRGGPFAMYMPLVKGDHVVLIFSDLATGQWRQSGEIDKPSDVRRHHLGSSFAIPGAFPVADVLLGPVNPLFAGAMVLGRDNDPTSTIRIKSGSIEIGGAVPVPIALAPGSVIAFNAIAAWIAALAAALVANPVLYTGFAAAMAAPSATVATALGLVSTTVPATIGKSQ